MKMIAGSVLILAAAVLAAAYWIGRVIQNPTVVGSPEAMYLVTAAGFLGLFGGAVVAVGVVGDRAGQSKG